MTDSGFADADGSPLAAAAREFAEEARARLGNRLASLTLYGSVARGEAGDESDVDLLAVVERSEDADELWRIAGEFLLEGVLISVIPETPGDVRRQVAEGSPFLERVVREGVVLHGRRADLAGAVIG